MYFTFSEESSYGVDSTSQDFVVDLVSEEIVTNLHYEKVRQFNYPTAYTRIPGIKTNKGRIQLELTYGNLGWNSLFKTLLGISVILTDFAFAKSSESWNIVTGMLSYDLDSSATSFLITEYKAGEFNNVDGVIINGEYIAVTTITDGNITASSRASEGTVASSHDQHTLVYGVVSEANRKIEIISRYRSGFCYSLPTSLTSLIYREGDYFEFNGCQFSDYVFNAHMSEIDSSFEMIGRNTRIIDISSPSLSVDDNPMVSPLDINCYCMNQELRIQKLYMQVSNTMIQNSSKFFDTTYEKILMSGHSAYGQFTLDDESVAAFNSYVADDLKNISITMCESKNFNNAYVFVFNRVRYGTMLHLLYSSIDMKGDSCPFYSYDPDGFNILIQT
jgi:hypothetical protein